ncbi:MAG: DUF2203 domain-containing protein [Planctomycetota bacterium]
MRKRYTVAEADRTLPYVRSVVEEVQARYRVVQESGRRHNALAANEESRRTALKEEIREAADRIRACRDELQVLGLEIEDYEQGLVDYAAEFEGRPILLCWKQGEERIGFWHEVEAGAKGRKPVPADRDWPPAPAPSKGKPGKSPKLS